MSSHTLEGKKKTQNGVKRLMFTVLSILLEVVFLVGIFKGLNEYAVFIDEDTVDHPDPDISDPWSSTLFYDRYERWNSEDADALQKD